MLVPQPEDIATIARLFVVWPVIIAAVLIAVTALVAIFIGINLFIFVGIPLAIAYAWVRYSHGPQWFSKCTRWVGEQIAAVSPAPDLETIDPGRQAIYSCHPHGLLAAAPYVHFTLLRQIPTMTTPFMVNAPVIRQARQALNLVDSNKATVDRHLAAGHSLTVILGGAREALATEPFKMRICADRRGMFELAVKHGVPVVPVLSYGENEMFTVRASWGGILGRFQRWFYGKFHGIWAFPNLLEVWRWLRGDIILRTFAGDPITPAEGETWEAFRERYKGALEALYERTRPAEYAPAIEWIQGSGSSRQGAVHEKLA